MKSSFCHILLSVLQLLIFFSSSVLSQQTEVKDFEYISPVPNSGYVSPYTNILIRQGEIIDGITINSNLLKVTGSKSGFRTGILFLSDDKRTIIYKTRNSFTEGETVTVKLENGIKTSSGKDVSAVSFKFHISNSWSKNNGYSICNHSNELNSSTIFVKEEKLNDNLNSNFLSVTESFPQDFPEYYISVSNNPSDGYIFTAPYPWPQFEPCYLIIMDNYGVPIFYRKYPKRCMDFKLNGNGYITYFNRNTGRFYELDSSYIAIDSFACGNGYPTDEHDLQILANEHSLLMSYDYQTVRMDTVVPGGDTAATVIGLVVQELDENKNVVFQWRSWDHFNITDATEDIDLTAHTIDYVHGNSVELDTDGNLIISCRHMDEITKISRATGEIIWRLGGENNQFQFVNDPRGFSHQHDARRISNGHLTLFNNGNLLSPRYSTSLEYQLDETVKTATLVWYYSDLPHFSSALGSSQRIENGRTLIGWGSMFNPAITEVKYDGTKTFELLYDSAFSYRAFRFPWRTNLFTSDNYRVDFEYIPVNTIDTKEIIVTNNSAEDLEITNYYSRYSIFSVVDNFPITLQPYQSKVLHIRFFPDSVGIFSDDIHLRMQKENEMIAQVIEVLGYSDPNADVEIEENYLEEYKLSQNYPNPFNPTTTIKYQIPEISFVTIKVYDVLGNEIATLVNEEKPAGEYNVEFRIDNLELSSGIYYYQLRVGNFVETKKMVLVK